MKRHSRRHTVAGRPRTICAIACALVASALPGGVPASANEHTQTARALAQERSYSSYGEPETIDPGTAAAQAQERYYSSYGEPQRLIVAQAPEPTDDTPWLPITISVAVTLAIVAAGATLARRLRVRRRVAA